MVKLILTNERVDVNSRDNHGLTPLISASQQGKLKTVELLLSDERVDVNAKDYKGYRPIEWAVNNRHYDVAKLIAANERADVAEVYNQTGYRLQSGSQN